jgi:hypothetical protein
MHRSLGLRAVRLSALVLASAAGVVACGDDDPATTKDSGTGSPMADASVPDSGGAPDAASTLSLYERLGGKAGLETFVKDVVETKILADADLKTFFFNQVATPIPAGHPSAKQIVVCFARFVGTALGSDTYPGAAVGDPANTNTPSFTCRDMVAAHKRAGTMLNIGSANFDKFIGHIATSLMPLVKPTATKAGEITQAEFNTLAAALNGQKDVVTTSGAPASGPYVPTLYDRLGGQAGLEAFVKDVVETRILADAELKTFFFNQVASPIPAGHPSAKQIVVCFARFVGAALGADSYPGPAVNDPANTNTSDFTCRGMVEAHKGASTMLHIGAGTFDKFIGHIAVALMPLVKPTATKAGEITQAEFDALAAALNGQKGDVTTAGAAATAGPFPN